MRFKYSAQIVATRQKYLMGNVIRLSLKPIYEIKHYISEIVCYGVGTAYLNLITYVLSIKCS